ncbi:hypothetical protein EDC04DRAFT_2720170 [Pisolithus marmoratus]|nr:hypothetical protein EDC04DRAFT_2720170 [Pisolithus marmoratus]
MRSSLSVIAACLSVRVVFRGYGPIVVDLNLWSRWKGDLFLPHKIGSISPSWYPGLVKSKECLGLKNESGR